MVRLLLNPDAGAFEPGAGSRELERCLEAAEESDPSGLRAEELAAGLVMTATAGGEIIRTDPRQMGEAIGRLSDAVAEEGAIVRELLERVEDGHADQETREALVEQAEVLHELAHMAEESAIGESPPPPWDVVHPRFPEDGDD